MDDGYCSLRFILHYAETSALFKSFYFISFHFALTLDCVVDGRVSKGAKWTV